MNSQLQVFNHEQFGEVSVKVFNEEVYFLGNEITKVLGYKNSRKALKDHCKRVTQLETPHPQSNTKTILMNFIPESDLYRLIISSKLPSAEQFEAWVFEEVLPSIRKHGGYIAGQEEMSPELLLANALKLADNIIKEKDLKLREEQAKNLELKGMNLELEGEIFEQMPKVSAWDSYLRDGNNVSISDLAKMLAIKDLGRNNMFKLLREKNILIGKTTEPYQEYINRGYFKLKAIEHEHANSVTLVTPKGMEWLKKKLVEWGYAFH